MLYELNVRTPARFLYLLACSFYCLYATQLTAQKPKPTLEDSLQQARGTITLHDGILEGDGAKTLLDAVAASRFVLLGESHLTREIPAFATALCRAMKPDAYAVEVGPVETEFVASTLGHADRVEQTRSMLSAYPWALAFLDVKEDNDVAENCTASRTPRAELWGLDQEFAGTPGFLLKRMEQTKPGKRSIAAIHTAQQAEAKAEAAAHAEHNVMKLYLLAATEAELQPLQDAVAADGTPETKRILREMLASRNIYRTGLAGNADANRVRAVLLKQHFADHYEALARRKPDARVFLKFGSMHTGKGFDLLHQRNLGNYVAELADRQGAQSLHIAIYGVRGNAAVMAQYRGPLTMNPYDLLTEKDANWIAPAAKLALPGTITIFDLRALRFHRQLELSPEWQAEIYRDDLLILLPETTPATLLEPQQ